jgi:hypothetical protein
LPSIETTRTGTARHIISLSNLWFVSFSAMSYSYNLDHLFLIVNLVNNSITSN